MKAGAQRSKIVTGGPKLTQKISFYSILNERNNSNVSFIQNLKSHTLLRYRNSRTINMLASAQQLAGRVDLEKI